MVTGSSDGIVRVVSIQPNRVLGVLGDHDDFPVEGMVSHLLLHLHLLCCAVLQLYVRSFVDLTEQMCCMLSVPLCSVYLYL